VDDADRRVLEGRLVLRLAIAQRRLRAPALRFAQRHLLLADRLRLSEQVDEHRDLRPHDLGIDRLHEVVDGAHGISAVDALDVGPVRGEEHDGDVARRFASPDEPRCLEPVEVGHEHVEEDHRELVLEHGPQGVFARQGGDDVVVGARERGPERQDVLRAIVDEQDLHRPDGGRRRHGRA
jgi:hypothetical protein